jgi:hypothetical protein
MINFALQGTPLAALFSTVDGRRMNDHQAQQQINANNRNENGENFRQIGENNPEHVQEHQQLHENEDHPLEAMEAMSAIEGTHVWSYKDDFSEFLQKVDHMSIDPLGVLQGILL